MDKEVKRLATEEVANEYEEMGKMKLGSEEHVKTAQVANGVMDRLIKLDEIENERRKLDNEEKKLRIEEERLIHDKKVDWAKIWVGVATTASTMAAWVWANNNSTKLELGGHMHSTEAGRSVNRKLLGLLDKYFK